MALGWMVDIIYINRGWIDQASSPGYLFYFTNTEPSDLSTATCGYHLRLLYQSKQQLISIQIRAELLFMRGCYVWKKHIKEPYSKRHFLFPPLINKQQHGNDIDTHPQLLVHTHTHTYTLSLIGSLLWGEPSENASHVAVSTRSSNTAIRSIEPSVTSAALLTFPQLCCHIFIRTTWRLCVCVCEQGLHCTVAQLMPSVACSEKQPLVRFPVGLFCISCSKTS